MKDAKTLLIEFLAAVMGGQNAATLFTEDGAVELPFLHSLGVPWRHRDRQAISALQDSLAGLYLDFAFPPEDTHVLIDTPDQPRTLRKATPIRVDKASRFLSTVHSNVSDVRRTEASRDISTAPQPKS
jgi:hypothetical protein